jgi:hypothetical protein
MRVEEVSSKGLGIPGRSEELSRSSNTIGVQTTRLLSTKAAGSRIRSIDGIVESAFVTM